MALAKRAMRVGFSFILKIGIPRARQVMEAGPHKDLLDVLNFDLITSVNDQVLACTQQSGFRFVKVRLRGGDGRIQWTLGSGQSPWIRAEFYRSNAKLTYLLPVDL